ncbi:MAG: hypothetical protein JWR26_2907 [Pedosphaera sp.]|nr:hypothetical protein [Pedosphaera sp.]
MVAPHATNASRSVVPSNLLPENSTPRSFQTGSEAGMSRAVGSEDPGIQSANYV